MAGFGINSFRGRFLLVSLVFVSVITLAAVLATHIVDQGTSATLTNAQARQQYRNDLERIGGQVAGLKIELLEFLIAPDPTRRDEILKQSRHLRHEIETLNHTELKQDNIDIAEQRARLLRNCVALEHELHQIADVRLDVDALYPATPILNHEMLPLNNMFMTASTQAMEVAAKEYPQRTAQGEVYQYFSELRYAWSNLIGAFRMYVANRSGVFGDPVSGMQSQEVNIALYRDTINENLRKLGTLKRQGKLDFVQEESLDTMRSATQQWFTDFLRVREYFESDQWRRDIPQLQQNIHPIFKDIEASLLLLSSGLDTSANHDIQSLRTIADNLSSSIWYIGVAGILISFIGFLLFENAINRPMGTVVQALVAESAGNSDVSLPKAQLDETRQLVEAFEVMRSQVHSRQQRLESILGTAAEAIITIDNNGIVDTFNPAATALFGYPAHEILGQSVNLLLPNSPGTDTARDLYELVFKPELNNKSNKELEVEALHKDGHSIWVSVKANIMHLDGMRYFNVLIADIRERKALMEHLKKIAEQDGLTGLYNRSYFTNELDRVVQRSQRSGLIDHVVLYIDLDNFKYVNDTLGHAAGDMLLVEISDLVSKRARRSDLYARFGGDEFTVLLFDLSIEQGIEVAEAIRKAISDYSFRYKGSDVDIGCSIGIAPVLPEAESAETVLSQADFACNIAKRHGRNRVYLFEDKDRTNVSHMSLDLGWSRRIKDALEHDGFQLVRQPILDMNTGEIDFYEILLRMTDETTGHIMPSGFLQSAERLGLADDIDRWVIDHALPLIAEHTRVSPNVRYAINLSGQTLIDLSVCDLIHKRMQACDLDPANLIFEITENVAIADLNAAEAFLSRLQMLGCQTALDDFGTGMSSFAYLRDLPVDIVKIDGRFVRNIANNPVDQAMVRAMNDIAQALGKKTVAEFVEDESCLDHLKGLQVDFAQGYHIGKPEVLLQVRPAANRLPI